MDKCTDKEEIYLSDRVRKQLERHGFNERAIRRVELGQSNIQNDTEACDYTKISNIVLYYPKISPTAKTLYTLLRSYAWDVDGQRKYHAYPTMETLGKFLGRSRAQVGKYTKELIEAGLISIINEGRLAKSNKRSRNIYLLLDLPEEMIEWFHKNVLGS